MRDVSERVDSFDVIVVGAGAAGLMAARELKHAGKHVCLLEASSRVGGRIITLYETNVGVPIELGAEFIHGDAPETTRLLDEARLVTVPVFGEHYRSDHGELAPQGLVWNRIAEVFKHLNPKRKKDRSFQDFLDEKPGGPRLRAEREIARGFVQGFFAADTTLISEKSLAEEGNPVEGAIEARRIVNGYAALIDYLQRDLATDIHCNAGVRRVIRSESQVRVFDHIGREHRGRAIIITVPLPMLQDDTIVIKPEIPMLRRAARQLVMGDVTRVNVVVKERFWETKADKLAFVHTPKRPFNVWWTHHPLRAPLITGWAGGPPALELARHEDVEGLAISELARVFGMRRIRVESLVDSIHTYDWTRDSNIRGAYSYVGVGGSRAPRVLARAFDNRIFLAGEATESGASGTVEGALATGKRAAHKVLRTLSS
jgi:monoamine oxidase